MPDTLYQRSPCHDGGFVLTGPGIYEDEDEDPSRVFDHTDVEQQRRIVRLMDSAHRAGRYAAQSEMRRALGIEQ